MKILEITVSSPDKLLEVLKEEGIKDEDIINVQYVTTWFRPVERGYKAEMSFYIFVRD